MLIYHLSERKDETNRKSKLMDCYYRNKGLFLVFYVITYLCHQRVKPGHFHIDSKCSVAKLHAQFTSLLRLYTMFCININSFSSSVIMMKHVCTPVHVKNNDIFLYSSLVTSVTLSLVFALSLKVQIYVCSYKISWPASAPENFEDLSFILF